jgi:DNA mismatch repair protein MutH
MIDRPRPARNAVSAPASERALLERARALAGLPLAELAARAGIELPTETRRAKGHAGALLERLLGATAGSRPMPDFPELGVELKSIPVDERGLPRESTFLCVAPLRETGGLCFEESLVWRKLQRVLWVPVEGDSRIPYPRRRIGWARLWSPDPDQARTLREDWEELMELLGTGSLAALDARVGRYLQLRPKGANGRALTPSFDDEGSPGAALPRGFYLRPDLTRRILEAAESA